MVLSLGYINKKKRNCDARHLTSFIFVRHNEIKLYEIWIFFLRNSLVLHVPKDNDDFLRFLSFCCSNFHFERNNS